MSELLHEIWKHMYIYWIFVKNCLIAQMEYRFNFLGNIAMEGGYLLVKMSYVVVVYRSGAQINGLTPDEILLFIGTFVLLTGVYAGMFMINDYRLRGMIKDGELDLILTKPVSLIFMATLRQSNMTLFAVDALAGGVMVAIAWARLQLPVTVVTLGGYCVFLALSSAVAYSLFLLPQILSFWLLNTSAIAEITDSFWDFNNMPMGIYSRWIQQIGVFVLPIFVITNFPPMFVLGRMPAQYTAWALVLPFLLLMLVRMAWNKGMGNYSSASS